MTQPFDWQSIVKGVAPVLGAAFGGPLAGAAVAAVANAVLGPTKTGDSTKDQDAIVLALQGGLTPELRAKLIEAEQLYKVEELRAQSADLAAQLADIASARERDSVIVKAGRENVRANWMVAMAALGLVACLAPLIFYRSEIPGEVVGLLSTFGSIFGLCLRDAYSFEFGSSRGSKDANATIAEIAKSP